MLSSVGRGGGRRGTEVTPHPDSHTQVSTLGGRRGPDWFPAWRWGPCSTFRRLHLPGPPSFLAVPPCRLPGPLVLSQWQTPQRWESCCSPFALRSAPAAPRPPPPPPALGHAQCFPRASWVGAWRAGGSQGTLATREFGDVRPLSLSSRGRPGPGGGGAASGDADASTSEVCGLGAWGHETEQRGGVSWGRGCGVDPQDEGGRLGQGGWPA